eukprot:354023-Chlamydomonas_euryale.AAC.5
MEVNGGAWRRIGAHVCACVCTNLHGGACARLKAHMQVDQPVPCSMHTASVCHAHTATMSTPVCARATHAHLERLPEQLQLLVAETAVQEQRVQTPQLLRHRRRWQVCDAVRSRPCRPAGCLRCFRCLLLDGGVQLPDSCRPFSRAQRLCKGAIAGAATAAATAAAAAAGAGAGAARWRTCRHGRRWVRRKAPCHGPSTRAAAPTTAARAARVGASAGLCTTAACAPAPPAGHSLGVASCQSVEAADRVRLKNRGVLHPRPPTPPARATAALQTPRPPRMQDLRPPRFAGDATSRSCGCRAASFSRVISGPIPSVGGRRVWMGVGRAHA